MHELGARKLLQQHEVKRQVQQMSEVWCHLVGGQTEYRQLNLEVLPVLDGAAWERALVLHLSWDCTVHNETHRPLTRTQLEPN